MNLLQALAEARRLGATGVTIDNDDCYYYDRDGELYVAPLGEAISEDDENVPLTLTFVSQDFTPYTLPAPKIAFTEAEFIATWDNVIKRSITSLSAFENSNIGKTTLNALKQLYSNRG